MNSCHWLHKSYVSPISKGGDISQVSKYRPISIVSVTPKIFESIVSKIINPLFKNIIISEQHGFVSERSITNLLTFHRYILGAFKSGYQVDDVFTDI